MMSPFISQKVYISKVCKEHNPSLLLPTVVKITERKKLLNHSVPCSAMKKRGFD